MKLGAVLIFALVFIVQTHAVTYTVDGKSNVVGGGQIEQNGVPAPLPLGTYTFTLTDSDYKDNVNNPDPQRFVVVQTNSAEGDLRTFALNGIGDSVTVQLNSGIPRLFIMETDITSDNVGGSTVAVTQNGNMINSYRVDGKTNLVGGTQIASNGVRAEIPTPGYYKFTLLDSTFSENLNAPISRHVVIFNNALGLEDFTAFTLNGIGDCKTLYCPNSMSLFFLDDYSFDNIGQSMVDVQLVPEPATISLLVLGGLAAMRRRKA